MTMAPVGIRCPDHAGKAAARKRLGPRPIVRAQRQITAGVAPVTRALIAINVAIYIIGAMQGGGISDPGASMDRNGSLYERSVLYGPFVAHGEWWRLVTSMFLHENLIHIGFNMLALYLIGTPVEQYLGRARYIGLYFVSGLAGSAGALLQTPLTPVLGASGAIFGILGAMLILEWQVTGRLAGQAMTWILINLVLSFTISNISWGGHVGGLIGGILCTLSFARWGRGHAAYGRLGLTGAAGLVVVAVASVAIAYWKVRGLA